MNFNLIEIGLCILDSMGGLQKALSDLLRLQTDSLKPTPIFYEDTTHRSRQPPE